MGREVRILDGPKLVELLLALGTPQHNVCFILEKGERVEVAVSGVRAVDRERTLFEVEGALPPFVDPRMSSQIGVKVRAEHVKVHDYSPEKQEGLLLFVDSQPERR